MNIFILDNDLTKSARMLCDQHLNKQILELAQVMCTIKHLQGFKTPYKPTHKNHPVVKWATDNIDFLVTYIVILGAEFKYRQKDHRDHSSVNVVLDLCLGYAPTFIYKDFPIKNDVGLIQSKFKEWITRDKPLIPRWSNRPRPECFDDTLEGVTNDYRNKLA